MPDSICLSHTVVAKLMSEHRCSRAGGKRPRELWRIWQGWGFDAGPRSGEREWLEGGGRIWGRAERGGGQRKSETAFPAASSFPTAGKESVQRAKAWRMEHISEMKMDVC